MRWSMDARLLRISAFLLGAAVAGCSGDARLSEGLRVTVNVAPGSLSQCVRVIARPAEGTEAATRPIPRKDELNVAVYRAKDWSGQVTAVARGYANCNADTAVTDFIEESEPQTSATYDGQVTLNLLPKPIVVVDNDGDGRKGAEDCDDNDPARFFGKAESCASSVDNNCSQTTGCADPACIGACDDNNACTATDKCLDDGGCSGGAVTVSCGAAPSGTCLFGAGSCNPADGGCMYAARDAGLSCNDGNACGVQDRCLFDGGCAATAQFNCAAAPNQCFDAGVCTNQLDAGCTYQLRLASSCVDNRNCIQMASGVCQADAGCVGAPVVCDSSGSVCKSHAGSCNPQNGQCVYTNIPNGNACDDGNACSAGTACNNGFCVGGSTPPCPAPADICFDAGTCSPVSGCNMPPVSCTPSECQTGGTCNVAMGGCQFGTADSGTSCSQGRQCYGGSCIQSNNPFDLYPAENFDSANGVGMVKGVVLIDCAAVFNTGTSATSASFTGCDGQTFGEGANGIEVGTHANSSVTAALLRISGLVIVDGGSLTINGDRPAMIGVYGDAVLGGTILLHATGSSGGPGSNLACNATGIDGSANSANGGAGAGGGGFAAAGGNGGDGDNFNANGVGGTASGTLDLKPLRGGCPGGLGSNPLNTGALAVGGGGGGALQISASRRMSVHGIINANGGGGEGGRSGVSNGEGAAGGGSGGAIRLEANVMTLRKSMVLLANGGTGGEGGDVNPLLTRKANGFDGRTSYGLTVGPGDGANGTNGGDGAGGNTIPGDNAANAPASKNGGGGGGGATGRIYLRVNNTANSCRENNYLISPSTAAATGNPNGGFTMSAAFALGPVNGCPP